MQTFGSFLVAALAAGFAAGSPLASYQSGSFELKQTANPGYAGRNGPQALANAYRKYGKSVPENILLAAEASAARLLASSRKMKRGNGTAVANPVEQQGGDLEYLVQVDIGTPAQTLNLDFDTGSSDLWVFSTETQQAGSHTKYDPSKSSSSKKLDGATWKIEYGDQSSCSGDVYTDAVTVGGLTVQAQAVESAQQVSDQFVQGQGDGLLGLAFSSINTVQPTPQKTWFDNVQSQLDSPLFVADLKHDSPGSYIFGSVPSAAAQAAYVSVDKSQGFWGFQFGLASGTSGQGIADTGTTLLLLDQSTVDAYYQQVQGASNDQQAGGYVFDCSATLPDFTFTVGSSQIKVPGSLINFSQQGGSCFGGLQASPQQGLNIFGDIALKAAYVIFDAGQNRVGWAQKA